MCACLYTVFTGARWIYLKQSIFHHVSGDKLFPSTNIAPMKSTNKKEKTLFHCKTLPREVRVQHPVCGLTFLLFTFRGRIPTKQTTNQPTNQTTNQPNKQPNKQTTKQTNGTLPWAKKRNGCFFPIQLPHLLAPQRARPCCRWQRQTKTLVKRGFCGIVLNMKMCVNCYYFAKHVI